MNRTRVYLLAAVAGAVAIGLMLAGQPGPWTSEVALAQPAPTEVPVGGRIQADDACYVRLQDMPEERYGGFGGYNPTTGVLAFAGGAEKKSSENTFAYFELFGIKLESASASWRKINYGNSVGYTQDSDKGCREMTSVQLTDSNWVSVFGKDGCDNGAFDTSSKKGGDIKEIQVGDKASSQGVRWVPNSGANRLVGDLVDGKGKLVRNFATYDSERGRIIIGQGTFNDERDQDTQDEVYSATKVGSKFQLKQMRPTGIVPSRRFGACAAHIFDKDSGVDGVFVLGGQQGGPSGSGATTYKEVWWLDFANRADGEWKDITSRFGNMDDIGYRREGACVYDESTKTFYSWMGRADSKIPDGAKRSSGLWSVDLSQLGDDQATLTWQRLAKDNLEGINGRRLIPSVWDGVNKRMLVVGGRNNLDQYTDVWAIYPGVTGAACTNLDPYEPFQPGATATDTVAPPTKTLDPGKTQSPATVVPPTAAPGACNFIQNRVPTAVINAALANPSTVQGYNELQNPGVPPSPWNARRTHLSLRNIAAPWHPLYNGLLYKAGCP